MKNLLPSVILMMAMLGATVASYTYCQPNLVDIGTNTPPGMTLRFLQMTIRHGDRTPITFLPGNGSRDIVEWECTVRETSFLDQSDSAQVDISRVYRRIYLQGREILPGDCRFGQLTDKGAKQHLQLGQTLRQTYVEKMNFLDSTLNPKHLWLRTGDEPRLLASAQSLLWGLYPPSSRVSSDGKTLALDIYTMDDSNDNIAPNPGICPYLNDLALQQMNTPAYKQMQQKVLPLRDQLAALFGAEIKEWNFYDMFDNFNARMCHGMPWPPGITQSIYNQVYDYANWQNTFTQNTTELLSLGIGTLWSEMLTQLEQQIASGFPQKFALYSGHDSTLIPLLMSLNVYDGLWPPYASHLILEVWEDQSNNLFVRLVYNSKILTIPQCATLCPFAQFQDLVQAIIPSNFESECMSTTTPPKRVVQPKWMF